MRSMRLSNWFAQVSCSYEDNTNSLLGAICGALDVPLSQLLRSVSDDIALAELAAGVTRDLGPASGKDTPSPDVVAVA